MRRSLRIMLVMLFCTSLQSWAQTAAVTGKVTLASGESLPGVNVLLKGSNTGTITDADGNYRIEASEGTLVFSFIGYTMQEVPINGRTTIDVVMEEDITTLEQVVVVGYGTQKRKDITTSIVVVDESAIRDRPLVSAGEALQGKAAGVQVIQPSGKPGGDISIRVRGSTSVLAGNDPLYVIDGVPTTDIRGLNPNDIATLSVLKDAASASIYGARAANGVVLITTKRGRANTPVLQFNAYAGFSKLAGDQIEVLNTEQYRAMMEDIDPATDHSALITDNYTNWQEEVFGTGVNQSYQLSYSGGNDITQYSISGNYLQNKGMARPASFDRYSVRLNLDNQLKKWMKIGTSLNYIRSQTHDTQDNTSSGRGGVFMSSLNTPPFMQVYNPDGSGQFYPNPYQNSWENPVAYMEGPDQMSIDNRLFGNVTADIKIIKDLSYKTNVGIDITTNQWDYYLDPFRTATGRTNHGMGSANRINSTTWLWENTLNYTKSFGVSNISVLVGTSTQKNRWDGAYLSGSNFPDDVSVKTLNAANTITGSTMASEWALASFFGRMNYDFDGKYLFTASVRRDGSSKLANKWGTMPAFSAGWRISSEPFMTDVTFIDDLKLRAGWGRNGNQEGIPSYAKYGLDEYTRFTVTPGDPLTGPASRPLAHGNPDLKWETTEQTNLGVDISILESRVSFSVDAYVKKTKDLILNVQLPSTEAVPFIQTNVGKVENKGLEFSVSSVNVDRVLKWNTDFNISFNRNEVTELRLGTVDLVQFFGPIYSNNQEVTILREGLPLGSFFGYVATRVDPDTGDLLYADLNNSNDGLPTTETTSDDRTVIGNAQPDFTYGLTNTFSYKRFDLNIFFQGSQGNDIYNATRIDLEGMFDSKNQSTAVLNRWTESNRNTDIPRGEKDNLSSVRNSTRFIEDGSYLRLKSVTIAYNLDPGLLKKIGIGKLSVYATGQNLLTFTNYSGFDPEVNAFGNSSTALGVDYGTYPQARTIIFGVNVEF